MTATITILVWAFAAILYIFAIFLFINRKPIHAIASILTADIIAIASWYQWFFLYDKCLYFLISAIALFAMVAVGYGWSNNAFKSWHAYSTIFLVVLLVLIPSIITSIYPSSNYKSIEFIGVDGNEFVTYYPSSMEYTTISLYSGTPTTVTSTIIYSTGKPYAKLMKIGDVNIIMRCGIPCYGFTGNTTTVQIDSQTYTLKINT